MLTLPLQVKYHSYFTVEKTEAQRGHVTSDLTISHGFKTGIQACCISMLPCLHGRCHITGGCSTVLVIPISLSSEQGSKVRCSASCRFLLAQSYQETQIVSKEILGTGVHCSMCKVMQWPQSLKRNHSAFSCTWNCSLLHPLPPFCPSTVATTTPTSLCVLAKSSLLAYIPCIGKIELTHSRSLRHVRINDKYNWKFLWPYVPQGKTFVGFISILLKPRKAPST